MDGGHQLLQYSSQQLPEIYVNTNAKKPEIQTSTFTVGCILF